VRLVVLLMIATSAYTADRAVLTGRVEDGSGAVLVDASLSAVDEETGIRRSARSDAAGVYTIAGLGPGSYKVSARKPGFQTLARLHVEVAAGRQTRLDFVLSVGSIREVITVEEPPRLLHLEDAAVGFTADRTRIDTLPLNGRGILGLAELAPGVLSTPASRGEAGQFTANGQRPNTNWFSVDGLSANSGVTGSSTPGQFSGGTLPAMTAFGGTENIAVLGAIQEVRVETSSFAPAFGRMPGAQVAIVTRSGSDEFHGALSYGLRNESLAANDWFANSRGFGKTPLRLNRWGGAAGGPVLRGRTYFFAAVEGMRLTAPFAWLGTAPSDFSRADAPVLDAFPRATGRDLGGGMAELLARGSRPSRFDSGNLRLDHSLTPHVALFGRYQQTPSSSAAGYTAVEHAEFRSRNLALGAIATPGPAVAADVRVNASVNSADSRWLLSGPPIASPFSTGGGTIPLFGLAIGGLGQVLSGPGNANRQGQFEITGSLAWTRGAHALRFGLDYERLTPSREQPSEAVANLWPGLASVLAGTGPQTAIFQADQASSLIEIISLYAQDTWQASPRLTLTYGARWEITPAPALRGGAVSVSGPVTATVATGPLWPTRLGQIAPRLGAVYRLSQRSVVRAGGGIFYDLAFSAATDPINGLPFNRWQLASVSGSSPSSGISLGGPGYAPELRLPRSYQWNVAVERALTLSDVVTASYVGSAGDSLLRREGTRDPASGLARENLATNHGRSDFHALEISSRRQLARGLQSAVTYTLAKSIDNASWDSAVALIGPVYSASADRALSAFDARHSLTAAVSYEPRGGWTLLSVLRGRTGFPIDVLGYENLLGAGFDNFPRPDPVAGIPVWLSGDRLNPAAFASPAGFQGALGRNAITGRGMFQVDMAVRRRFALADTASLEFGVQAYNALNHPQLADPVRYLNSPWFGQPVSMLNLMLGNGSPRSGLSQLFQPGGPRSLVLSMRLRF
jgi:hypothetical protein